MQRKKNSGEQKATSARRGGKNVARAGSHIRQQILVGGVGGQGVLFVTRLLAEAAIRNGFPVLTTETHGMAQRGGTVVSHIKIGDFASPMIRPFHADGLIALKPENVGQLETFLKPDAWVVVNGGPHENLGEGMAVFSVDADMLAQKVGSHESANLVLLGFAMAQKIPLLKGTELFPFCRSKDIEAVLESRLRGRGTNLESALHAFRAGFLGRH